VPADRGGVAEDADPQHDDDGGGQLRADAQLVTEEHDQRGDDDVRHEGDHEHLGVEDPVEPRAEAAEHGIEGGDDRDRQVGLQRSGASSEEALAEAERQAEALGILTGTVPATGPGVSIVIRDPDGRIPPEVMLDAIQELRNAGAEAFQVGAVRIGVDSAFTGSGGAITVDGVPLIAPYTVTAIGDPPTLAAALAIPGGVFDTVRRAGGTMDVTQSDSVLVDSLRPSKTPLYARPAQ